MALPQVKTAVETAQDWAAINQIEVSPGIAPILKTLNDMSSGFNRPLWSLFLINVETLIRDRKNPDEDNKAMAQGVIKDMITLCQFISAYCRYTLPPQMKAEPMLCFYFPIYSEIPAVYKRDKFPKGTENFWAIRDLILKHFEKHTWQTQYDDLEALLEVAHGPWPHRNLLNDLIAHKDRLRFRKTLMVSHVPLDFHLYRVFKDFTILESYTGNLKTIKQFGKKVFDDEAIPFNKYTHLVLGDKWYLKCHLDRKSKKELKQLAVAEHWALMPDISVAESLIKHKTVPKELILNPEI